MAEIRKFTLRMSAEEDDLLEAYCASTEQPKTEVIRECIRNLRYTRIPSDSSARTLFYIGRQMYRDHQPMPSERVLMLGWRFERDMQVELEERLNNLEEMQCE